MTALTDADQDAGLRDYVDRLRSWGENDPDPSYFTGDVLNCLLLDCGHASVGFATLRSRATAAEDKLKDREAEIERLREALADIEEGTILVFDESEECEVQVWMDPEDMQEIARAALASTDHPASSEEASDAR